MNKLNAVKMRMKSYEFTDYNTGGIFDKNKMNQGAKNVRKRLIRAAKHAENNGWKNEIKMDNY